MTSIAKVFLMDASLYISKTKENLADSTTYRELDADPTLDIRNDIMSTLDFFHQTHLIDDEIRHYLTPSSWRTLHFLWPPQIS